MWHYNQTSDNNAAPQIQRGESENFSLGEKKRSTTQYSTKIAFGVCESCNSHSCTVRTLFYMYSWIRMSCKKYPKSQSSVYDRLTVIYNTELGQGHRMVVEMYTIIKFIPVL